MKLYTYCILYVKLDCCNDISYEAVVYTADNHQDGNLMGMHVGNRPVLA